MLGIGKAEIGRGGQEDATQGGGERPSAARLLAQAIAAAHERSADVLTGPGDDPFGHALIAWLRAHVPFDHCVTFGYRGTARPPLLFETFNPAESHVYVTLYQVGPYLLDPFYHAAIERVEGFRRMRELAPDRFYASEYYRSYYSQTVLAEEAGFFVPLANGASVVVSLMRKAASGAFGAAQVRQLRELAPIVLALCRLRWGGEVIGEEARGRPGREGEGKAARGVDRGTIWRDLALTSREGEVVDLILQGHSADSIARLLSISAGTAKVHRRNIYRKLNINSQAGLFAHFVAIMQRKP
ncbi:helix-turn-helix transcriptional regulator [Ancylobacter sp. FA202]|uniref:helix-turn-helix transcriptional regulator n=1 Tax=Ancylobacter sp. FA202 TaxID=1111106 RepID=UPI000374A634|nr:helix-turn-helix transcriptional regulator [Ancylobacter sp. FA202]